MKIKELRSLLEAADEESEILIIDKFLDSYQIQSIALNSYFVKDTTNNQIPFCLKIED